MKLTENNPVVNEQLKHLKEAKSLPKKKRLRYYFDFFKMPALYTLLGLVAVFFLVKTIFFSPETIFNGSLLNAMELQTTDEEFLEPFCTFASLDSKKSKFLFTSTDYYAPNDANVTSRLLANIAAGESDFFVCNETDLLSLADDGYFEDVTLLLPEPLLSSLREDFFYYDYTQNAIEDDDEYGNIPIAIRITNSPILAASGSYAYEGAGDIYFCFAVNSDRVSNSLLFLQWLLGMEQPISSPTED